MIYNFKMSPCDSENGEKKDGGIDSFIEKQFIEQRRIIISESINQKVAERVIKTLFLLDGIDNKKPITVIINSPGGEVFSGFAIYDIMKSISSPIITLVTGFAASMGSIIMLVQKKAKDMPQKIQKFLYTNH